MNRRNLTYKLIALIVGLLSVNGCGGRIIEVHRQIPVVYVRTTIPLRIVLVVPESTRQYKCNHCNLFNSSKFDCGLALYDVCLMSLEKIFFEIQAVKEINQASRPWDCALWLELDEFKISYPALPNFPFVFKKAHSWINLKYKLTNKDNEDLIISNIFNKTERYFITTYERQQDDISALIERAVLRMVEEVMQAYKNGWITPVNKEHKEHSAMQCEH